jgi:hypothetical protein
VPPSSTRSRLLPIRWGHKGRPSARRRAHLEKNWNMESRDWPLSPSDPQAGSLGDAIFSVSEYMSRKRSNPERNPGFDDMATAGKFLAQWRSSAHSCDLFLIDPVACGCFEVWTSKNLGMAREGGRDRAVEHPSWTATPHSLASQNKPPPVAPCSCTGSGIRRVVCSWIS